MSEATGGGLAPGFLVASPGLRDPNFATTLVLMAEHQAGGALGFVVNRTMPITIGEVLGSIDLELLAHIQAAGRAGEPVLGGGPVQPERLWILHRPGPGLPEEGALRVAPGVALGGSRELLDALVHADDPGPYHLLLGYAGWAPLQVEKEISAGAWVPMALHEDLVLEVPLDKRWETAVRRLGLDPAEFLVGHGGASA